jgi:general secretion pathway protein G
MSSPRRIPRLLFPWEGRGGLSRFVRLGPLRPVLLVVAVVSFVTWVGARERRAAGMRQTRATLLEARRSVEAYLADHDGGCPPTLEAVATEAHLEAAPRDAWGRPLRLVCPGRFDGTSYELMSDGPDGEPGGLDRIE